MFLKKKKFLSKRGKESVYIPTDGRYSRKVRFLNKKSWIFYVLIPAVTKISHLEFGKIKILSDFKQN